MEATTKDDGGGAGSRGSRKVLRALAISPDLDKLLEHEERSRSTVTAFLGTHNSAMGLATTTSPVGLPPPPRGNRQKSSRIVSATVSDSTVGQEMHPVRNSNPYINPAPTMDELFPSSSHDSEPGPSEQSVSSNDQQCLRRPATRNRFRAQTLGEGANYSVSPIRRFFAHALHHSRDKSFTPRTAEAGRQTNTIEFKARIGISSTGGPLANNTPDPSSHRMSFIEIYSPSNKPSPHMYSLSTTQPVAPSPPGSPKLESHGVKPPVPTTPKPVFSRHPSFHMKKSSPNSLPSATTEVKPTTTNFLDEEERADLVRKSRKLTRLFGETPNAEAVVNQAGLVTTGPAHGKQSDPNKRSSPNRRDRRDPDWVNSFSRRHSLPPGVDLSSSPGNRIVQSNVSIRPPSPVSFVEMSDARSLTSASLTSVSSSNLSKTTSIDLLEEERRIKRERLAKLYRFLGSQVPINLALGINDDTSPTSLPLQKHRPSSSLVFESSTLLRRRRSSSAISSTSTCERLKADLDDREKAIIVRRAQKMEKLFGVAPPIMLYRPPASAPCSGSVTPSATRPQYMDNSFTRPSTALTSSKQRVNRPDTPESSKQLLSRRTDSCTSLSDYHLAAGSVPADDNGYSSFYKHYEHSLNSLNDILDRDDRESLAKLHQTLRGDALAAFPDYQSATTTGGPHQGECTTPTRSGRRPSFSSLLPEFERRGSLPARTSMISIDSEYSIPMPPPMPEATSFQQRRKRAAKLTHFFGVDYRELFDDVLDSIEYDMKLGQKDGKLRAEEVEDLLQKLLKLKYRRQRFL